MMAKSSIVGMFKSRMDADRAFDELMAAGISRNDISLVGREEAMGGGAGNKAGTGAGLGAVGGATVGGIAGLLTGIGAMLIPGIGPIIAVGTIATALAGTAVGAAAGAAAGGIAGALVGLGIPENEAKAYSEGVRSGGILMVVHADGMQAMTARTIMQRNNATSVTTPSMVDAGNKPVGSFEPAGCAHEVCVSVGRPARRPTPISRVRSSLDLEKMQCRK
jgi:hypothetical protein